MRFIFCFILWYIWFQHVLKESSFSSMVS
jgi:hypothetical protein